MKPDLGSIGREIEMRDDYRGLGPGLREREEARASAATEDDGRHRVRAHVPPRRCSGRRRRGTSQHRLHLAQTNTTMTHHYRPTTTRDTDHRYGPRIQPEVYEEQVGAE